MTYAKAKAARQRQLQNSLIFKAVVAALKEAGQPVDLPRLTDRLKTRAERRWALEVPEVARHYKRLFRQRYNERLAKSKNRRKK